ncbi:hypothetical protein AHAS_AhasUnG0017900 [Arachis hypogaea]
MLVLIPYPLALVDFQKKCAHQLMSACAMEYPILGNYRFHKPLSIYIIINLFFHFILGMHITHKPMTHISFLQNGDIININVTVYFNVCF